ncbi:MAG: YkvA family protein [Anaerolineae bacterium]|nr:YkvA family protein [Anaerolineae bacterium]
MAKKKSGDLVVPAGGGVLRDLVLRFKLIVRLMGDKRINPLLKLLPFASLAYLISPIDLIPVIPGVSALDDIAIVSLGAYLFVEFCPPNIVEEHMKSLSSNMEEMDDQGEVVDAEAVDIDDKE